MEKHLKNVEEAQEKLTAAQREFNNREPENALQRRDALEIAQARLNRAEEQLLVAQAAQRDADEKARLAAIETARPLASHAHFVKQVAPLVGRLLAVRKQLTAILAQVDAVVANQNSAADVCGAPRLGANHVLARVVAEITRDGCLPLNAAFLQPANNPDELWAVVMSLYGQNTAVRPMNESNDALVDHVLSGGDVNRLVYDHDAGLVADGVENMAVKQKELDQYNEQEKKKLDDQGLGSWFRPATWFEPIQKMFTPKERLAAERPELATKD